MAFVLRLAATEAGISYFRSFGADPPRLDPFDARLLSRALEQLANDLEA
jgi:hypothetical protein